MRTEFKFNARRSIKCPDLAAKRDGPALVTRAHQWPSCMNFGLAFGWKRGWGDLVLIQTSLLLIRRLYLSCAN